ncbi:urease accessory protein UreD [Arthrobacter sp. Y-9]|uniref:urease accessory protein UreD n=1 Tax=Arthrobacter sp. Y-9 TaxID=3039385 RepID=UPI00241D4650|nr:urease accessory protein UreD [Arthrobacter sp. Y-9]WFR82708.1 urease accessory protein UreD [Arthrobacter sp. Y-9]
MTVTTVAPGAAGSGPAEPTGELRLRLEARNGRSVVAGQFHSGALRMLRPLHPGDRARPAARRTVEQTGQTGQAEQLGQAEQVLVTAINPGGGYLGGDRYVLGAELGADTSLLLTTQSATKVYRTPQGPARSSQVFRLDAGARLESVPDALIAYQAASYHQDTEVRMHPSASLALAETVTHGWAPDGTPFRFDEVSLRTRVHVGDRLAVSDNLLLHPDQGGTARLMLGGHSHLATLLVVDPRADDDAVQRLREELGVLLPSASSGALLGITRLAVPGFVLRALTGSTQSAEAVLHRTLDWMRREWHGQPPVDLRKY